MSQRREGYFWVSDYIYDYSTDEIRQRYLRKLNKLQFTPIRIIEGNKFSTPFQDIWTNPEKTHLIYSVCDPVVNTNYIRISGDDEEPESIDKMFGWFPHPEYTELCEAADEALKEEDEEEAIRAIFNIGVGYYLFEPPATMFFERYLQSPSVKIRLATIRAISFQLWDESIPILEKAISSDEDEVVRIYAQETLKQIQQPNFLPEDTYINPTKYPNSFEGINEKGLILMPQIEDELTAWMEEEGIEELDAFVLYEYLVTVRKDLGMPELLQQLNDDTKQLSIESKTIEKLNEPEKSESENLAQLKQELHNNQQKLTDLKAQQIELEERIKDNKKTDLFRKNVEYLNRLKENLNQEVKEIEVRIAEQESLIKAEEGQQ